MKALLGLAVAPLVILVIVASLPFVLANEARAAIALRVFRRREAGRVYLVCTTKRNWHSFLQNNVIPILPDTFRVVWHKSGRGTECVGLASHLSRSHVFGVPKPYMVVVTPRALLHRSLNASLQPLKVRPEISDDTRKACADIIQRTEDDLRADACTPHVSSQTQHRSAKGNP